MKRIFLHDGTLMHFIKPIVDFWRLLSLANKWTISMVYNMNNSNVIGKIKVWYFSRSAASTLLDAPVRTVWSTLFYSTSSVRVSSIWRRTKFYREPSTLDQWYQILFGMSVCLISKRSIKHFRKTNWFELIEIWIRISEHWQIRTTMTTNEIRETA